MKSGATEPAADLVIGYGSELRRDDAAGPRAAEAVAAWGLPGVRALAVPQLLPELAEPLSQARRAFFVDARPADGGGVALRRLGGDAPARPFSHAATPEALLALAGALFGRRPEAWLVTIPVPDLGIGPGLSPEAEQGVGRALGLIREMLAGGGEWGAFSPLGGEGSGVRGRHCGWQAQPPHPHPLSPEGRGGKEPPHPHPRSPRGRGGKNPPTPPSLTRGEE